jgi:hypothetical protein
MLATGAPLFLLDLLIKIVIRPLLETQRSICLSIVIPVVDDDDDEWTKPRNNAIRGKHGPTKISHTFSPSNGRPTVRTTTNPVPRDDDELRQDPKEKPQNRLVVVSVEEGKLVRSSFGGVWCMPPKTVHGVATRVVGSH